MKIATRYEYELWEAKDGAFCIIIDTKLNKRYIYKTYGEAVRQFIEWTERR